MVTLKQLRFFCKVMETRNITQAAEQLHVAQPALGTQIRELESELEVQLLHRHSRGVEPTPAGVLLHARASAIFDIVKRTRDDLQRISKGTQYKLNLGLTTSLMLSLGADLLLSSRQQSPAVVLHLHENPSFLLVDAVERRELDVALAYDVSVLPGLECVPVLQERLFFVTKAGPERIKSRSVGLAEVLEADLVLGNERDVARKLITEVAQQHGKQVQLKYETQSIAGLREMVLRGAASSVLPLGSVFRDVARGELSAQEIANPFMHITLYTVKRVDKKFPEEVSTTVDRILQTSIDLIVSKLGPGAQRI